jgi:TM2 domain-containing membrane protein YozV
MSQGNTLPRAGTAELPEWERLRVSRAESEYAAVRKDPRVAYGLWCVVGIIGGHRFYLGDTGRSIAMLFTLGGCGVWTLIDLFFVGRRVRAVNRSRRAAVMTRYGILDAD